MPQQIFDSLKAYPCDIVDLGGLPHGLRVLKVRCDREKWLEVSMAIIHDLQKPGLSSLLFLTSRRECEDYAKTANTDTAL